MSSSVCTKEEGWRRSIWKAQQGDKEEKEALVLANIGLIYMVLKRFANRGYEKEDLFQIGAIGLLKAIDKFDLKRELSFSTYAVPMIIGEIRRFLRDDGIIHVSRQIKENARVVAMAKEEFSKTNHSEPTMEDLSRMTGLAMDEILIAMEATTEVESIYQPIGSGTDSSQMVLADHLMDEKKNESEVINRITVEQIMGGLEARERELIRLRYMEGKTQSESAKYLGMNQVAVSRLEKKILYTLRKQV